MEGLVTYLEHFEIKTTHFENLGLEQLHLFE